MKKAISFRLDEELLEKLSSEAGKQNRSVTNLVETTLKDSLEKGDSLIVNSGELTSITFVTDYGPRLFKMSGFYFFEAVKLYVEKNFNVVKG